MENLNEYILKNCTLISMDSKRPKVEENMDIWIKEDKIYKIEKHIIKKDIKSFNMNGKILMPGLINCHAHTPMCIFRETLEGFDSQTWLNDEVNQMEKKYKPEDMYTATLLSSLEAIKSGTTTINDMYRAAINTTPAFQKCKLRVIQTQHLLDSDGNGKENIKLFKQMMKAKETDLITYSLGIHSFYAASPKYLKEVEKLREKYNLPIHTHFCENDEEASEICNIQNVQSPVDMLEKYKQSRLILAHCVALNSSEIMRMSKFRRLSVVFNPVSNLRLGCGIAKINQMVTCGINVCLGTDGQGSGSSLDLFDTMKIAALVTKGYYKDPVLLPSYEVLKMATINGAKALGMDNKIGSITEGKCADIIAIDLSKINTNPINNIFAQLVYNTKGNDVCMTIVNGEILYIKDKYLVLNEENEIIAKVNEIKKRVTL